ncbi:Nop14-like protein [Pseudovirgaria hyperparasitica]|uniref:Nop14-like protein n=1 Tax=Pseudovirgaria hyperparasitica TaxID=470096 RepID=A0A6A6VRN1_9PEZI|nr:Nop14-like protein [Pseudovirgaria hyperparasitica]KAF2753262.1 Nop14-like protein [Pseudovirgaria hyperparasitica]
MQCGIFKFFVSSSPAPPRLSTHTHDNCAMPPSQLKRLKTSLHEKGILGPQKSKKQKKNQSKNGENEFGRAKRNAALAEIREVFNPFDVKALARPKKFEATTLNRSKTKGNDGIIGRPGVTKGFGEETRRATLLPELNRRNKVGGINDRRFGENDPTMTPEERAMKRFIREKQRGRGASMFDLEEAEDGEECGLTHGGKALNLGNDISDQDDFDARSLDGPSSSEEDGTKPRKRRLSIIEDGEYGTQGMGEQPERKKSKAEVMKEVIAKSKLHKYERQQAKDEDEEEREKLDEDLPVLLSILRGRQPPAKSTQYPTQEGASIDPGRKALLAQVQMDAEKDFDRRVRDLARDKKAQPTERTKTEEEKAIAEALRLKDMEQRRLRRMRGEIESDDEDDRYKKAKDRGDTDVREEEGLLDDAEAFGITRREQLQQSHGVEDEDDFLLDDDLIATGSDLESDQVWSDDSDVSESEHSSQEDEDNDDEFIRGLLPKQSTDADSTDLKPGLNSVNSSSSKLAYTYACPTSHAELLEIFNDVAIKDAPTVVQRIRSLYHPQLSDQNTAKLSAFSMALVDHLFYLGNQKPPAPLAVIDALIRHLHSLSRQFAEDIGQQFRRKLSDMQRDEFPTPGDLILLTAIGTIYPTSDHFHQIVTPAITIIAKWLNYNTPRTVEDLNSGAYMCTLVLQYQRLSKRYVPELLNFCIKALESDMVAREHINCYTNILIEAADLWSSKLALTDIFSPTVTALLQRHKQQSALQRLQLYLNYARVARRPLELHHHRPIPIKSQIPSFEESFNPNKHYDPNRERAEASKLKAEYKKERKGALRELRKDANFIARTKLREKKEADVAYEAKYKKLIASIQTEEGAEANQYDRIKRARKSNR